MQDSFINFIIRSKYFNINGIRQKIISIFEKTSFLQGSNSNFIKELYLQYLKNPEDIPESWKEFFDGLDEDQEIIKKEILGPSWSPKK